MHRMDRMRPMRENSHRPFLSPHPFKTGRARTLGDSLNVNLATARTRWCLKRVA